jgi:hypothetical protein
MLPTQLLKLIPDPGYPPAEYFATRGVNGVYVEGILTLEVVGGTCRVFFRAQSADPNNMEHVATLENDYEKGWGMMARIDWVRDFHLHPFHDDAPRSDGWGEDPLAL